MEEKEVRIPILGVIDEDKLECHENRHLFETYTHGNGVYLIKRSGLRDSLRNVSKSNSKNQNGKNYATWDEFILPVSVVIEDTKKEQETQLKEAVEPLNNKLLEINETVNALCDSLNSLQDDSHVIERLQSIEETLKQLTEANSQHTENGSASGNGISEKTLLEALAIVTKKV